MVVLMGTAPVGRLMEAANARWQERSGQHLAVLLRGEESGGRIGVVEVVEMVDASPRHCHPRHDELLSVLEGGFDFEGDARRVAAREGTIVFVPRGVEHGYAARREPTRLLAVSTPGRLEADHLAGRGPA